MSFLWKSVVGKLWMTIISLVTVVLLILSILLVQFFDRFYYDQQYEHLKTMATKISHIFETYENKNHAVLTASELVEVSRSRLTVIAQGDIWQLPLNSSLPKLSEEIFIEDEELNKVFKGHMIEKRDHFYFQNSEGDMTDVDVIVVGVPLILEGRQAGAVYVHQTLDDINRTINTTKELIVYAAGIGIFLTTIFAFFLSTRITSPLRQMKMAADRMAEGNFHSRVSIRSSDEIGTLASTFNHMANYLNETIHELSQEKEQLSNILRSMVDGVITLDVQGHVILINPPAKKMLQTWKYEEKRDKQNGYEIEKDEEIPSLFLNIFNEVVKTEKEYVSTVSAQGRFWTIAMAPLYNRKSIRGTVAVIRDMTEERRLDKLRIDFLANVSHELRTPLAMMQGYSEALRDEIATSPEERQELVQIIYDESLRMGRLVNELLDLARMEAGHTELQVAQINVASIVQKTLRKFSGLTKEKNIRLIDDINQGEHLCELDPDRIEQIFINLVNNAIHHTPEGGEITVSLREDQERVYLTVQDTGNGIDEEDLPFVFERFYKGDKARTRGKAGTGLGLAIAKQLVEAQGGQIQVHSKKGEGTTFSLQFPRVK